MLRGLLCSLLPPVLEHARSRHGLIGRYCIGDDDYENLSNLGGLCGLSSSELMFSLTEGAVAEHGEEHVAASSGEGDESLVVPFALRDFPVVVGA